MKDGDIFMGLNVFQSFVQQKNNISYVYIIFFLNNPLAVVIFIGLLATYRHMSIV